MTCSECIDFEKDLKIGLSPVGKTYAVCALLQNALTCLYGSNTAETFGISPPTLEFYFNGQKKHVWTLIQNLFKSSTQLFSTVTLL